MWGINGIVTSVKRERVKLILEQMNKVIYHRGPDDEGVYIKELKNFSLAMGMRRLSIIDLSTGSQPISNEDERDNSYRLCIFYVFVC